MNTAYTPWPDQRIIETLGVAYRPSDYQFSIYHHVLAGERDGLVNAVAGAGKTTTILHAAKLAKSQGKSWMFVAFGHEIMTEINAKLAESGMTKAARTAHALGKIALVKRLKKVQDPTDTKYRNLIKRAIELSLSPRTKLDWSHAFSTLQDLTRLARLTLTDISSTSAIAEMAQHYSIDLVNSVDTQDMQPSERVARIAEEKRLRVATLHAVRPIIDDADRIAEDVGLIDFTDMLWLPYRWNLVPYQSDVVLVDECQDLNAAQLDLVLKLRKPGGQMIFVGDPNQAIFGFAGADDQSFWRIAERTNAAELPLSISYRCPQSHVALAQEIVPAIEAKPGAMQGIIETIAADTIAERVKTQAGKCLILCRLTAPLVEQCLKLIGQHIHARVRGRDIGAQLQHMVDDVTELPGFTWVRFMDWLTAYETAQIDRLRNREDNENQVQSLIDRVSAIRACYDGFSTDETASADTFKQALADLFSDAQPAVWLSTVHRAKGLEFEHVYILKREKMPLSWPSQQDWERQQEEDLRYVALTRSNHALYFVVDFLPNDDEDDADESDQTTAPLPQKSAITDVASYETIEQHILQMLPTITSFQEGEQLGIALKAIRTARAIRKGDKR